MDDPKKYAASDSLTRHDTTELIEEYRNEVKAMHGRILDIGCGPGDVTKDVILHYLPDDAVVDGVDISPNMIDYAEEYGKDEKRVSFFQLNIETPDLPVDLIGNYDHIMSFYCLHWCQKTETMLDNMYKLLRPDGTVLILFLSHNTAFEIYLKYQYNSKYSIYMKDAPSYVAPQHGLSNPDESLRENIEKAGFEVLHCSNRWKTFTFTDLELFLDLMMSVSPFFNKMPENLQNEYRKDVARDIKMKYLVNENEIHSDGFFIEEKYSVLVAYFKKSKQG